MKSLTTLATIAIAFTTSMADAGYGPSAGSCRTGYGRTYQQPAYRPQPGQYQQPEYQQRPSAQYRAVSSTQANPQAAASAQPNDGVAYSILVEHPLKGEFVPVTTITGTEQARAYYDSVKGQVWLLYRKPGGEQPQLNKVESADAARQAALKLKQAGYEVLGAKPLKFKIEGGDPVASAPTAKKAPQQQPAVDPALKPLLGIWKAVARDADGQVQTVLMKLEEDGYATVSVPNGEGRTTVRKKFTIDDGRFVLSDGKALTELGKVVSADADRVVLDRNGSQVTFLRP